MCASSPPLRTALYIAFAAAELPSVSPMRRKDMCVGGQYEMQRGPTRRPVPVTLMDKRVPSERNNYVLVRIDGGLNKGSKREVPSASIHPLPGTEPARPKKARQQRHRSPIQDVPEGWTPSSGEVVTWTQTLDLRLRVSRVDAKRGIATVAGKVFGMRETYEAPISELRPLAPTLEVVPDEDVEECLGDRLPEKVGQEGISERPPQIDSAKEEEEDLLERLIFAPNLLNFYRRRFASDVSLKEAERRLRVELKEAKLVRKRHTGEYLRFRVKGRFDVVLDHRPGPEDFKSCYVTKLRLPRKKRRTRKAA